MRECCRQVEAEVLSKSKNEIHHTWGPPISVALYMMFSKLDFNAETGEAVKEPETKEELEEEEAGPGPDPEANAAAGPATNDHNNNTAAPEKLASVASEIGEINSFRICLEFWIDPTQRSTIKYYPPSVIIFSMFGKKV